MKLNASGNSGGHSNNFRLQKPCASKAASLRVKDTSRSLCYPILCGHCLPFCQAKHQAPGLLVKYKVLSSPAEYQGPCINIKICIIFASILH